MPNHSSLTAWTKFICRTFTVDVSWLPVEQSDRQTVFTTTFDATMRERLRALCTEYQCSAAHVIRQLICEEYRHLFPNQAEPPKLAPRATDLDKGEAHERRIVMAKKVRLKREMANTPQLPMRPAPLDGGTSVATSREPSDAVRDDATGEDCATPSAAE